MNVVILVTPKQFSGISTGMTTLLRIIGSAMVPLLQACTYKHIREQEI